MPEKTAQQENQRTRYAHVKIPAAFVQPHTVETKDGRTIEKAYVHFPQGTKVNGIEVGGYSCDVLMNAHMKQQMLSGQQPTLRFKADEPVAIWKGKKGDAEHPYQRFEVNAFDLCHGLKTEFDSYKADKAAERAAAKEQRADISDLEADARSSAAALAGDVRDDAGLDVARG